MTEPQRIPEVFYKFACKSCGFVRQTKDRSRIPDYCPTCAYPKDAAGHVYRREPEDGHDLDS